MIKAKDVLHQRLDESQANERQLERCLRYINFHSMPGTYADLNYSEQRAQLDASRFEAQQHALHSTELSKHAAMFEGMHCESYLCDAG